MSEDLAKEISELKRRLAELEAKQSAQEPPRPRMNMPKIDYTENFRLPPDAAQAMAKVVHDPPKGQKSDMGAWARNRIGQPGGFGPAPGHWPKPKPTKNVGEPVKDERYMSVRDGLWSKPK